MYRDANGNIMEQPPSYQPRQDPLISCRFIVETDTGDVVAAFSQFSGMKMEVQTLACRFGEETRGVQDTIPVMTQFAPVTFTKGVIGELSFLDWIFSAAAGMERGPSGEKLCRTLLVVALDEQGRRVVSWRLKDAMPVGYEISPMDALRTEVLTESITFQITGVERNLEAGEA